MKLRTIVFLFLVVCALFLPSTSADYVVDGDTVYIDDANAYMSATPHTIASTGWVYFNLTPKQYSGELDAAWGFNTSVSRPIKAGLYAPHWVNTTTDHQHTFYNVSQFQEYYGDDLDYGNPYNAFQYEITHEIPTWNETTEETDGHETAISNVSFDSQVPEGNNHTAYWYTHHDKWVLWKDKTSTFESIEYNHNGYDKWYFIKNVDVVAGQSYLLRAWVEVPISLTPSTGKYYYAVKPSSQTISQAIAAGNFYALDPWWNSSWTYYKTITINQTMVSQDIGNVHFPMLVSITDTDLRDHAQSDGDDIVFLSSDNTTQLAHEIELWNSTTGELVAWVNVSDIVNVSSINMYYNNSGATNTEDIVGVWDSNYVMVQHLNETPPGTIYDSTSNDNDGTTSGMDSSDQVIGQIDGSFDFDGVDDYVTIDASSPVMARAPSTINMWVYYSSTQAQDYPRLFWDGNFIIDIFVRHSDLKLSLMGGTTYSVNSIPTDQWVNLKIVSANSTTADIYFNGVFQENLASGFTDNFATIILANRDDFIRPLNGTIDEIHISNIAHPVAYIETDYNNTAYPALFISVGAEQSEAPTVSAPNITLWQNNKTLNNTLDFTINVSEEVNFNATANQTITTWNWYKDDVDQSHNYDNITVNWSSPGLKHVVVNVTNANGTSNSITWNVTVQTVAPTITLISFTPTPLNTNYTGATTISYMVESTNPLNLSSLAFLYGLNYTITGDMHNYITSPSIDIASEGIYLAPNRNVTPYLSWEFNDTITEGNVWQWGGGDNNSWWISKNSVNATHTWINITGVTQHILPSSFYIQKLAMYNAPKTGFEINRQQGLIFKMWNVEEIRNRDHNYFANLYFDTSWESTLPTYPVEVGFCNFSYDPTVDDIDTSPNCTKFGEWDGNRWVNHSWVPGSNASYAYPFVVNASQFTEPTPTDINYIWLRSNTISSKSYILNATDYDPGITNITFAETNTMWTYNELNGVTSPVAYTPSFFTTFVRDYEELLHHLYIADDTGAWGHSNIFNETIGLSSVPVLPVSFEHFNVTCQGNYIEDTFMDATYDEGNIFVNIHCPADPDGGIVSHNLTLHYATNQTLVAVINDTFTTTGDEYVDINFTTTLYYSSNDFYTLRCVSTDDENDVATKWLISDFTLDADGNQGWVVDDALLFWGMNNIPALYATIANDSLISYNVSVNNYTMHVPFFKSKSNDTFRFNETVHLESLNNEDVAYFRHSGETIFDNATIHAWNTTTDTAAPITDEYRGYVYSHFHVCGNITNSDFSYIGSDFYRQEGLNFIDNPHDYLIYNTTFSHNAEGPVMEYCSNMNISQCTITDNVNVGIGMYFTNDTTANNNTISSNGGRGISIYDGHNNIINYNDIIGSGVHGIHLWSNSGNNTATANDISGSAQYDYYMSSSSLGNYIIDPASITDRIRVTSTSGVNIENTDNTAFSEDSLNTSYAYLANFSMYVSGASQTFDITQQNMTVVPATDKVAIWNIEWDTSVQFNANSDTADNPTWFNITDNLWIDTYIYIYRNDILYDNQTANGIGLLAYNYTDTLTNTAFEFRTTLIPDLTAWEKIQESIVWAISIAQFLVANIGVVIVTAFSLTCILILMILIGMALSVTNIIYR